MRRKNDEKKEEKIMDYHDLKVVENLLEKIRVCFYSDDSRSHAHEAHYWLGVLHQFITALIEHEDAKNSQK